MPIRLAMDAPTLLLRKDAFERARLTRASIDEWLNLTADEFTVEGNLIAVGPMSAIKKIELDENEKLVTIRAAVLRQVKAHPADINMGVRGGAISTFTQTAAKPRLGSSGRVFVKVRLTGFWRSPFLGSACRERQG